MFRRIFSRKPRVGIHVAPGKRLRYRWFAYTGKKFDRLEGLSSIYGYESKQDACEAAERLFGKSYIVWISKPETPPKPDEE